ncbi:dihydrolipoyllysine-residue succinyltransferase component of 2-oxoglutarate dehydrogenase complex [Algimonas ampicilliniresistens]|uniref:Dihydrolipoyllysine-residue succinyltransferase component of 2-oxoglutarate dehydrogenase complex n=1 Tax=Algimonas ampicilliniresistens TaxID=1298735 RepID=A0ABQ5V504_9PROT|nr:2-oxoglutarate dehydrogenase complex dihydrolipoyllysine-residue succinyltransferase [Algimonas ampicilliniresistens]GLQ22623.1 dihydrolipoyllysine-residue succinyltransferase component of 2-oxoglutarate dehydrogenase complex [Algimonas ampicilliniresistens]
MTDIVIPNVGESVSEVTIASWMAQAGDTVKKDDPIVEIETDKASQELVAPEDGVLSEILVAEGETVAVGTLIAKMGEGSGKAAAKKEAVKGDAEVKAQTEAPASNKSSGSSIDINVPNVGESVSEVTVASWMKQVGDAVEKDEAIVELETDKAAQELVAPRSGVLTEILVAEGDIATIGQTLARLGESQSTGDLPGPATAAKGDEGGGLAGVSGTNFDDVPNDARVMPAAAKIIRENDLDASKITGSGKDGRILKADAAQALSDGSAKKSAAPAAAPTPPSVSAPAPVAPSAPRETGEREERVRMSRLRQTIARRLKDAQNTAAMLTTYNEADMSEIMAIRSKYKEVFLKKHGVKLGFMSFFVKACVQALKEVPTVNAEIDGTDIIYKNFYDISIAVGTDKGLVVPVLRDADVLSLGGIEKGIGELGAKARDGNLSMDDMRGGTFTISNGGVYGSLMSSPILNPPQSGILGMHTIQKRPVVVNDEMVIRPMMYLALSYDHRIVDGKEAVTFLVRVKECLEDPERLLLDL